MKKREKIESMKKSITEVKHQLEQYAKLMEKHRIQFSDPGVTKAGTGRKKKSNCEIKTNEKVKYKKENPYTSSAMSKKRIPKKNNSLVQLNDCPSKKEKLKKVDKDVSLILRKYQNKRKYSEKGNAK